MLVPVLLLLSAVTSNSSTDSTKGTLSAVPESLTPILELALGFLLLTSGVLLLAGLAEVLVPDHVANGLLGGAEGLVPGSVGALLVVFGDGAGVGVGGNGAQLGSGVRSFVFGLADFLSDFALVLWCVSVVAGVGFGLVGVVYLGGRVAGDGTSSTLGETSRLVKVGLAGGRVAVRHDDRCGWWIVGDRW